MKRHLQIIMVLAMAFVLSACSGRMVNLPVENTKAKKVPAWYLDHEDTGKEGWVLRKGYYYAVAVAVSPSISMSSSAVVISPSRLPSSFSSRLRFPVTFDVFPFGIPF